MQYAKRTTSSRSGLTGSDSKSLSPNSRHLLLSLLLASTMTLSGCLSAKQPQVARAPVALPDRPNKVLPRPDAIQAEEVEWFTVQEGQPAPVSGFAVTVEGFKSILNNDAEARRWVREALLRLQEYEKPATESSKDE